MNYYISYFMKKFLYSIVVLIVILFSLFVYYQLSLGYKIKQDIKFNIIEGESIGQIAENLKQAGAVKSSLFLKIYARLANKTKWQAGDYVFQTGNNAKDIVRRLVKGEADFEEKNILIKEGLRLKEISAYLKDNNLLNDNCDKLLSSKISQLPAEFDGYDFLKKAPKNASLEGYLFPDTYRVFVDADCQDLLLKMLDNFSAKVGADLLAEIKKQNKSLYEILTMASLLEKEVKSEEDMKIVAGVFWDRITNGQRLESCATLAYILGENKPQYSLADTQIDSPYNTYRNDGLPPSPINNPGLKAIKAAIYPTKTDYNFFLSRPDTGATVFAKTFEEHKANKAKYLK